jgi:tetratricopeptide (TPR) repeat protein
VLVLRPWKTGSNNKEPGLFSLSPRLLVCLSACLFAGGLCAFRWYPLLAERLRHLTEMASRKPLWGTAWQIFCHRPLTGCGLDAFDLGFCRQRGPEYWRQEWGLIPTRAHNDFLSTLATQGAVGGLAFLVLAATLVWACRRAWRLRGREDLPLIAALAAAVVAWHVQNLFGFPVVATTSLFTVLAGMLSSLAWPTAAVESVPADGGDKPRRSPVWLAQGTLALGGVLAGVLLVVQPYLAGCICRQGEDQLAVAPRQALASHELAVHLDPGRDVLWIKLAAAALVAVPQARNPAEERRLLLRAREAVEEACALVPASAQNHANRARTLDVLAREGVVRREAVLRAYDEALARDPLNTQYLAEAGRAAHAAGLLKRARAYLERGLEIDPHLGMLHTEWGAIDLTEKRYREGMHRFHIALGCGFHGDNEEMDRAWSLLCLSYLHLDAAAAALPIAEGLVKLHDDSLPVHLLRAQALEQLGRGGEAVAEYRHIVSVRPDHPQARAGLSRLAARK